MEGNEAERVRALGEVLREFDLDAIRLRVGETEIEVVRREAGAVPMTVAAAPVPVPAAAAATAAPAASAAEAPANARRVTAPLVGVFYRAPSPGAPSFVEIGDRVAVGQTLCILEAMKLMNEITSDYAGVVRRVLPENGDLVTLGQELFWIEP